MLRARTTPPTCITVRSAASLAAAASRTAPPSALIGSRLARRALDRRRPGRVMLSRPEPVGSTSTALPATSAVVPPGVAIEPAVRRPPARPGRRGRPARRRCCRRCRRRPEASLPPRQAELAEHELRRGRCASVVATRLPTLTCEPGAKQHAVRVLQVDVAVGDERAEDRARLVAGDAVERHRAARRLDEAHRVAGADREALPVGRPGAASTGSRSSSPPATADARRAR